MEKPPDWAVGRGECWLLGHCPRIQRMVSSEKLPYLGVEKGLALFMATCRRWSPEAPSARDRGREELHHKSTKSKQNILGESRESPYKIERVVDKTPSTQLKKKKKKEKQGTIPIARGIAGRGRKREEARKDRRSKLKKPINSPRKD